jgi:tetratricopeptide (TPR) repeat protein
LELAHPPAHPNVISARVNLASTIGAAGRHEEAAEAFRSVLAALEDANPSTQPIAAAAHLALNLELAQLGRVDEALESARKGLAIREQLYDDDHRDVAEARAEVGYLLLELGRASEALPLLEGAWRVREGGGATPNQRADTGFRYAKAIRATGGSAAEARRVAEAARDLLDPDANLRAKIDAWLAALR